MKFFFDNNLSLHLAHAIRELSKSLPEVESVVHLRDRFKPNERDLVWAPELVKDGPWSIISMDHFTRNHNAEREALRRAGHTVFVLDRQWSKHLFWAQGQQLIGWWPKIVEQSTLVSGGAFSVPWRQSAKRKFLAMKL
ncbi:MAG: hypothetical protein AB1761_16945 [Pseudomonadota bacterium]